MPVSRRTRAPLSPIEDHFPQGHGGMRRTQFSRTCVCVMHSSHNCDPPGLYLHELHVSFTAYL